MAHDPISEVDDNQLDRVAAAKKAQEAMEQQAQPSQADASLAATLMLLGPALQQLSQVEHHKGHALGTEMSVQTPAQLFASSKSSQLGATPPSAGVGASDSSAASNVSDSSSSADNLPLSGGSGVPTEIKDWRKQLESMVAAMEKMPAGEAINYITQKLLPFMGSYKQWEMSQEGVTMQNITALNGDWSRLKTLYNECNPNNTTTKGTPAMKDPDEVKELIQKMYNTIQSDGDLSNALMGKGGSGFTDALDAITGGAFSKASGSVSQRINQLNTQDIITGWQNDWKSSSPGSGDEPSGSPSSTMLDAFTQMTTTLNNQTSAAQGAFKQDNSDYNTFNQVLTQTLKQLTSEYNYFNQKMTGG